MAMYHCCLNVRGALKNMPRKHLAKMFKSATTGKFLPVGEAEDVLLDHLSKGREVIPLGPACEGFDYAGTGCPGHEVAE